MMKKKINIADQLHAACMCTFGFKPSRVSVISYRVISQYGALDSYAVLVLRIVRRPSKKNPGRYWQVTSNVLDFITLNSDKMEIFNTQSGLLFNRKEVLQINRLIKDGINPLDKIDMEKIATWSDREKESLSRVIWLD